MEKVRFGIIGLGGIARRFAKVLATSPDASLYAVAARDGQRAQAFGGEFGAEKAYGSYEELMEDPAVELVYVALTHNFHYEVAKQCLLNGKAVLCEKPFFLSAAQAREIAGLAKEKNLLLMEAMWTRCLPAYQKAVEWLRAGRVGTLKYVDAKFTLCKPYDPTHRLFNPEVAGGALYDTGVYPIEFIMGVVGERPAALNSLSTFAASGVDDYDVIQMRFPCGAMATAVTGLTALTELDAKIFGTDGYIVVRNFLCTQRCELYDGQGQQAEVFEEPVEDGFIYEIAHASQLLRAGKIESPLIPWDDTIACAEVFDQVTADWQES